VNASLGGPSHGDPFLRLQRLGATTSQTPVDTQMTSPSHRTGDLEQTIDDLVASYESSLSVNNLESAALPNRRRVIEAFDHIKPALFMGFFSHHALDRHNLRYTLSAQLYPAYELLTEQIRRAQSYEVRMGRQAAHSAGWAEDVVLRLFAKLPSLRGQLDEDVAAAFRGDPAAKSVEEIVFSYPAVEAIVAHRIAHALHEERVPIIPRIISEHAHGRTGIDIHPGARIGSGFFIDHGTGVVVGETAVIGSRVKLYQGVTLGALSVVRRPDDDPWAPTQRHPTIEDDVTIYAGATILGGETVIGAGSTIGGNVWLIKSVPPGSKVFGRARDSEGNSVPPAP